MIRRPFIALLAVVALALAAAAPASGAVRLVSETFWYPPAPQPGSDISFVLAHGNAGSTASGPSTLKVELPAEVTVSSLPGSGQGTCSGLGTSTLTCSVATQTGGNSELRKVLLFEASVGPDAALGVEPVTVTRSGGGQPAPNVEVRKLRIGDAPPGPGVDPDNLIAGAFADGGDLLTTGADFTQAAGHPYNAQGYLRFKMKRGPSLQHCTTEALISPAACYEGGSIADIVATLPPGFVGDPMVLEQCPRAQFPSNCPPESQVGMIDIYTGSIPQMSGTAVYNLVPPPDQPVLFGFNLYEVGEQLVYASVRSDGDYGITVTAPGISEGGPALRANLVVWGTPSDPSHDIQRCDKMSVLGVACVGPVPAGGINSLPRSSSLPEHSFLSMPTNCADSPRSSFYLSRYADRPPLGDLDDPRWFKQTLAHPDHSGCAAVPFDPTIDYEPDTKAADTPSGLDVHLNIPRDQDRDENGIPDDSDPEGLIQAHLKKTTTILPKGVAFNASAADGILGCTPQQIGLVSAPGEVPYRFNNAQPKCPQASKVANARVVTPVLDNDLTGEVFLASQDANPFDSTYAIYIVVREPSILVKLPGKVEPDPVTGQLRTTFDQNPQLPFSDLYLDFFGGPRGSLATPKTCGTFNTRTEFVPWSAEDPRNPKPSEIVVDNDTFTVDQGANGAPCVSQESSLPFDLGLSAGSTDPLAAASSPFRMQITRPDGHQDIDRLEIAMPPGFTAELKGIPSCSEAQIAATRTRSGKAEEASSACPAASRIGSTLAGAGAGSAPLYRPGKLYLAGPYKGHALSVVAVTPAVAGPFDLGNVVVRSALAVDPVSARVTAITDPLPQVFEGVPLRIRDIRVDIDRPGFARNPTNCAELATEVRAFGANGGADTTTNRYQATGCAALPFKPRIDIRLFGGVKRAKYQGVRATVRPRPGDANISGAVVKFPTSAFVAQEHLSNICTRVQWANEACPKNSVYGTAEAVTPLLDEPLKGNVHLRSSSNLLPDLVADLRGPANQPIKVEVAIETDAVKGALRNTVRTAPDASVTYFRLQTFGGKKGLIVNSRNICKGRNNARVTFNAHNGRRSVQGVPVRNAKCAKLKRRAKAKAAKRKRLIAKQRAARAGARR